MRRLAPCIGVLIAAQCGLKAQTSAQPRLPAAAPQEKIQYVPLTQGERARLYLTSIIDPVTFFAAGAGAGIQQWEDTPGEWGQGAEGYGRRVAGSYAGHLTRQTLMLGASSLLDEDNRYLPSGQTSFGARLKYGIESEFLTRRSDGMRRFAFSRMGADLGTAFLSRAWQPASTRSAQDALSSFGVTVGVQIGFNVAREFLPFLRGH